MPDYDRELKIKNPDLSGKEFTYLTSRYTGSGTALTVANNEGVADNDILVVGVPGEEKTEAGTISGTTGDTQIDLDSALNFSHAINTPLFRSKWDQIVVERQASGGSYSAISGSPFTIEWDEEDGRTAIDISSIFEPSDNYRWQFRNSQTTTVSGYADALIGTGLARNTVGGVIALIKKNPVAKNVDDATIIQYFNDLHDEEYENNPEAWYLYAQGDAISTVADTYLYDFPSDFGRMKYLLYHYTSGDIEEIYPLDFLEESEMRTRKIDQNQPTDDIVTDWSIWPPTSSADQGQFAVHPTPETADHEFIPVHFKQLAVVDSYGDTLTIPKPKIYLDYALYRIYDDIEEDEQEASKYAARVNSGFSQLKKRQHRQVGQKVLMKFRGTRGARRPFTRRRGTGQTEKELYW